MQHLNLSKEAVDFLFDFANQIETQDNRATASPYYYQVRCIKEIAAPKGMTEEKAYYIPEDAETWTEERLKAWCLNEGLDFDDYVEQHCEEYSLQAVSDDKNIFFTKKGFDKHMELNGHNYRDYKRHYPYINCANRNPEIKMLLETVLEVAKQLKENVKKTEVIKSDWICHYCKHIDNINRKMFCDKTGGFACFSGREVLAIYSSVVVIKGTSVGPTEVMPEIKKGE